MREGESKEPGRLISFSRGKEIAEEKDELINQVEIKLDELRAISSKLIKLIQAKPSQGPPSDKLIAEFEELQTVNDLIFMGEELLQNRSRMDQDKLNEFLANERYESKT